MGDLIKVDFRKKNLNDYEQRYSYHDYNRKCTCLRCLDKKDENLLMGVILISLIFVIIVFCSI